MANHDPFHPENCCCIDHYAAVVWTPQDLNEDGRLPDPDYDEAAREEWLSLHEDTIREAMLAAAHRAIDDLFGGA